MPVTVHTIKLEFFIGEEFTQISVVEVCFELVKRHPEEALWRILFPRYGRVVVYFILCFTVIDIPHGTTVMIRRSIERDGEINIRIIYLSSHDNRKRGQCSLYLSALHSPYQQVSPGALQGSCNNTSSLPSITRKSMTLYSLFCLMSCSSF